MNLIPVSGQINPKDWNIETKRLCHKSYNLKEHCPEYTARITLSSFLPETFPVMMIVAGVEFLLKESNEFRWNVWMNTFKVLSYVMVYAFWYHLYNLKIVKNTHGVVLPLVKLQAFRTV